MLWILVAMLCVALIALIFAFAYLMGKWHGCMLLAVFVVWVGMMRPVHAGEPVPSDDNWPTGGVPVTVLVGYNVFGERIVLFAQFCDGEQSRKDHMHMYGIYTARGAFVQGGCWKFDPVQTRKTRAIQYFDLMGNGWGQWPLAAFHQPKQQGK